MAKHEVKMSESKSPVVVFLGLALLAYVVFGTSGCVRAVDAWGLKVEFAEGLDFHAGANGIDRVDDRRGIGAEAGASVRGQSDGAIMPTSKPGKY